MAKPINAKKQKKIDAARIDVAYRSVRSSMNFIPSSEFLLRDNPRQVNFAPTIRLHFHNKDNMIKAIVCVFLKRPDEMCYVSDNKCDFWWDY